MTPVERVLILKSVDLLKDVGPRHLLALAEVAHEVDLWKGDSIYREDDPADALYIVVSGRVRLSVGERPLSEVGPGEAFGSWSLVDDSARGQRAECAEDGVALALGREEFYEVASGDLTLLEQLIRVLAKRLRALVAEQPGEARVEGEGVEKPEAVVAAEEADVLPPADAVSASPGQSLQAAALGKAAAEAIPPVEPESPITPAEPTGPRRDPRS